MYYTLKSGIYVVERKINVTVEYGSKYVYDHRKTIINIVFTLYKTLTKFYNYIAACGEKNKSCFMYHLINNYYSINT